MRPGLVPAVITPADVLALCRFLASIARAQDIYFLWPSFLPDPKDDMLLELAVASGATQIVTHKYTSLSQRGELRHSRACPSGIFAACWSAIMSTLTIQLPDSLHGKLRELAEADGTSVEQLVAAAAGEKLAAMLEGAEYLRREAALGSRADFERVLAKVPKGATRDLRRSGMTRAYALANYADVKTV